MILRVGRDFPSTVLALLEEWDITLVKDVELGHLSLRGCLRYLDDRFEGEYLFD
jgi:hypothetical protein